MKERGELSNDTIVTTVMSNMGLYKALDKKGIKYEKTKVGDKYVYENMLANGHSLGGEQSGHIIFSKLATTGDGILTSLKVMEAILESKVSLSELHKDLKIYPQHIESVRVKDKKAFRENAAVAEVISQVEKELGNEGRILVRESGTEPCIRVMVEAGTRQLCLESVNKVVAAMKEQGLTAAE